MGHQTFQFLKRNVCQVGRGDEFFLPPAPRPPLKSASCLPIFHDFTYIFNFIWPDKLINGGVFVHMKNTENCQYCVTSVIYYRFFWSNP